MTTIDHRSHSFPLGTIATVLAQLLAHGPNPLRRLRVGVAASVFGLFAAGALHAQSHNSFLGLGDLPGGTFNSSAITVSPDGSAVAGIGMVGASTYQAFRWTPTTGIQSLGFLPGGVGTSRAEGISLNGFVIVGGSDSGVSTVNFEEAFRWTEAFGLTAMGDLPGGWYRSVARAASHDGSVIVGWSDIAIDREAFRWTAATGMVGLGFLSGSVESESWAYGVSADGAVVVGYSSSGKDRFEAFKWTTGTGMVGLGFISTLGPDSRAYAVSADGTVVVGEAGTRRAFRWTAETGMVSLGVLPGMTRSIALSTSADGSIVVGHSFDGKITRPFIWDSDHGMRDLQEVLVGDYGVNLDGWTLESAFDVADDGRIVVGDGINQQGDHEAWIARMLVPPGVPSASVWGLLILGACVLVAGTLIVSRSYQSAQP